MKNEVPYWLVKSNSLRSFWNCVVLERKRMYIFYGVIFFLQILFKNNEEGKKKSVIVVLKSQFEKN